MPFQPAIEEPSNILPSAKNASSTTWAGTLTCCSLPRVSVRRKSTNLTPFSFMSLRTSAADIGFPPFSLSRVVLAAGVIVGWPRTVVLFRAAKCALLVPEPRVSLVSCFYWKYWEIRGAVRSKTVRIAAHHASSRCGNERAGRCAAQRCLRTRPPLGALRRVAILRASFLADRAPEKPWSRWKKSCRCANDGDSFFRRARSTAA